MNAFFFVWKFKKRKYYLSWLNEQVSLANIKSLECPSVEKIIDWCLKQSAAIDRAQVIECFKLTAITSEQESLFDISDLNRKLDVLIDAYLQSEGENEREYMDDGEKFLEDIALSQELLLEEP